MRRAISYTIILVLLAQIVLAGEVFNNEVKDNVPFFIDGVEHVARYYPSAKKVSLSAGTERALIEVEDCDDIGPLKYCIDSATEGYDEETGGAASTMELRVVESGPSIDIDRSFTDDDPNLNEEVTVTATLTNKGNERASNINYEDSFPSSVKVVSTYKNAVKNGVLWAGSLNPGDSQTITYKLTFKDFLKYNSTAVASWVFNNKFHKSKDDIQIEVQTPYTASDSISSKSVDLNEVINYNISINSTDESQDIDIRSLEVILPEGASVTKRDMGLEGGSSKVTYSGNVAGGESESFSFSFKSTKKGKGELKTVLKLRIAGADFTEEFTHTVGFGISAIMPEITFNPDPVKGGAELEVEAKIVNEGDATVSGISLDMTGDLIDPRGWRKIELTPGGKHYAVNKIMNAPSPDKEREYFIKLSGSYVSSTGKVRDFEGSQTVTVLPQEQLVEMTPVIDELGDGKYNVTLKIKNIATYPVTYISLIDTFPKGFTNTEGNRDADIEELAIGEELTAYSYTLQAPETFTGSSFDITHIFNGLDKDEEKLMSEKVSTVVMGGAAGDDGADSDSDDESDGNETATDSIEETGEGDESDSEDNEEKKGIFSRIWSWLAGLFSKEPSGEDKFE